MNTLPYKFADRILPAMASQHLRSPPQPPGADEPGQVGGAVLHQNVQPRLPPVDDAIVVANDERVPQLAQDVHLPVRNNKKIRF